MKALERFMCVPGLTKVALGFVLLVIFHFAGTSLRWPLRIVIGVLLAVGIPQMLYMLGSWADWRHAATALVRHPLIVFVLWILVSLSVKENFPLSHFPMYSDPNPTSDYFYVKAGASDQDVEPVSLQAMCKITSARVKKIYRSRARKYQHTVGKNKADFNASERAAVGLQVLEYLAGRARAIHGTAPQQWRLIEVIIHHDPDRGIVETPTVIATFNSTSLTN